MDEAARHDTLPLDRGEFGCQDLARRRILVPEIDVGFLRLHPPRCDQHPLEKLMWIALQIVLVLEGAGLAFIAIDAKIAWARAGAHELPLLSRWKTGAAEASEPRLHERVDHLLDRSSSLAQSRDCLIAAGLSILFQMLMLWFLGLDLPPLGEIEQNSGFGMIDVILADRCRRCAMAASHAGCMHDSHVLRCLGFQRTDQRLRSGELA